MTAAAAVAIGLLAVGVGVAWVGAAGLLASRSAFDRLHAVGPVNVLGPVCVAGAVVVAEGASASAIKAVLVAVALLTVGPILTHATARAARFRAEGSLGATPEEAGR